jgi:hypothetical protein
MGMVQKHTTVALWSAFESGSMYTECMNIPGYISSIWDWNLSIPGASYWSPALKIQL